MKQAAVFAILVSPAFAHVISMSSGDLDIHGARAHYELRLPIYEAPQTADPAQALFEHVHFASGGRDARLMAHACRADAAHAYVVCDADYEFAAPVENLDVDCSFYAVIAPNHVHLLRVENNGKRDEGIFDAAFSHASLRFRAPTALEIAATQSGAGFLRALSGPVEIVFLAALVLAARSRRELATLTAMFVAGQICAVLALRLTVWQPPPRFVEAAAALTIAYLAAEILFLPNAGMRWLIVAVLGAFHGLYFDVFLRAGGYGARYVLGGAACAELPTIAVFALLASLAGRRIGGRRLVPVPASLLLAFGVGWFLLRLRG